MSEAARIKDLVNAKLAGRAIDPVGFLDELLRVPQQGTLRCHLASEQRLRFDVDGEAIEVDLDSARGKLRMLCARLSVLCHGTNSNPVSPYGGEGMIDLPLVHDRRRVCFENTPDQQGFEITSVPAHFLNEEALNPPNSRETDLTNNQAAAERSEAVRE